MACAGETQRLLRRGGFRKMDDKTWPDVELVNATYDRCWAASKGPFNSWIDGRLHPLARRFYIVVSALEVCLQDGVPTLLEEVRFGLAETADAFESFGFEAHAHAVRELNALVDDRRLSRDRRERQKQLNDVDMPTAEVDRLNRLFPHDEDEVWRRLATVVREHPEAFGTSDDTDR